MRKLVVFLSGMAVCGAAHADLLVNKGAKGTLSVQYEYSATGAKKDKYDPASWRVLRTIKLTVPMTADPPVPASSLRAMDPAYAAEMEKKKGHIQDLHKTMAPTMADMMKIADRCGEDEGCIERAIQDYGKTMDKSTIEKGKSQAAAAGMMGGPRFQLWQPSSQKGTYAVDETYHAQTSDPACANKPKQRCTRDETRKGGGDIPAPAGSRNAATALLEVDSVNKDVLIKLPVPLGALTYTRQVTSDFPDEKSGTSQGTLPPMAGQQKTITVALPGDLRGASGTESYQLEGEGAEGGTMKVTWQFAMQ
jgi:hypothetical protein